MKTPLKTLVVGIGGMGGSHALGYSRLPGYGIAGIVVAKNVDRAKKLSLELGLSVPIFTDYYAAMRDVKPDVVSINTYPDTHAEFSIHAMRQGCHVFMEKPIARTVAEAEEVAKVVRETKRKLLVGYILRQHPAWKRFIELARTLGKPLIMRMNLNQQSYGDMWKTHKSLMQTCSPIVDCGVHYVDVMCLMTGSRPVRVSGIGARLSDELPAGMVNYGQLQVTFADGSVGWYEAGWGPMMSEEAFFVKDVIGPKGCVSIVAGKASQAGNSADVDSHSAAQALKVHSSQLGADGKFTKPDEIVPTDADPGHDGLCEREQAYFEKAIREDIDLTAHMADAVNSMRIVAAADQSFREGRTINL